MLQIFLPCFFFFYQILSTFNNDRMQTMLTVLLESCELKLNNAQWELKHWFKSL